MGNLSEFNFDDSDDSGDDDDDAATWPILGIDGVDYKWNQDGDNMLISVNGAATIGTYDPGTKEIDFISKFTKRAHQQSVADLQ